ncbi:MAG: gamma-glutamyl-phosphate reductase, partial [Planctomycetaceae bacterium]|nr:gamma-glutamyl-phosphate reductase [Planctomycetaceae bacterium]
MTDTLSYSQRLASNARGAATQLASVAAGRKNAWLQRVADTLRDDATAIVAANTKDMDAGVSSGLSAAMLDRLKLTPERIETLARAVEHI